MKKTLALLSLCLVGLIAGCAPLSSYYTHPTKNAQDFERDYYECDQVATQYASNIGTPNNPLILADELSKCLRIRYGWQPANKNRL